MNATAKQVAYLTSLIAQTGTEVQRSDGTVTTDIKAWAQSLDSTIASAYIGQLKRIAPARPPRRSTRRGAAHQQYANVNTEDEYGSLGR